MKINKLILNDNFEICDKDFLGYNILNNTIQSGDDLIIIKNNNKKVIEATDIIKKKNSYLILNSNISIRIKKKS